MSALGDLLDCRFHWRKDRRDDLLAKQAVLHNALERVSTNFQNDVVAARTRYELAEEPDRSSRKKELDSVLELQRSYLRAEREGPYAKSYGRTDGASQGHRSGSGLRTQCLVHRWTKPASMDFALAS